MKNKQAIIAKAKEIIIAKNMENKKEVIAKAKEIIKPSEGLRLEVYKCPAGKPTIGYGHLIQRADGVLQCITQEQAEWLLEQDIGIAFTAVCTSVIVKLNVAQMASLISFVFNVGRGNFAKSTLLKKLNANDIAGASEEFVRWIYANGQPCSILEKRRKLEQELFNS